MVFYRDDYEEIVNNITRIINVVNFLIIIILKIVSYDMLKATLWTLLLDDWAILVNVLVKTPTKRLVIT